jgi:hypothetical protein
MASFAEPGRAIASRILEHMLGRLADTAAIDEPFSHIYLEEFVPADIYERLLHSLPDPVIYTSAAERHYRGTDGAYVRRMFQLTPANIERLSADQQSLWRGLATAMTAPELKHAMFTKLARDLSFRYRVSEAEAGGLPGYARPTLYRETEGFEIPPHPDTRKKVVTMHLYWPTDRSQLDLGTALYRRRLLSWPLGGWQHRFVKVKQFPFQPNSGYAFVVNNSLSRRSWHGREKLPAGAGVRNTLLNTFYALPREGFGGYLDAPEPATRLAA